MSCGIGSLKEAVSDINKFLAILIHNTRYLDIIGTHQAVIDIKKKYGLELSPILKILLTTNGSVTQALQSIQDLPTTRVRVKTLNQVIVGLSGEEIIDSIYTYLHISRGASFNYRKVVLHANDKNLALAISLTPLYRLGKDFQDDLLRADKPIGFILEKYKLEVLRRISVIDAVADYGFFAEVFKTKPGQLIPYRVYDVMLHDEILMKIAEFFNPSL
ncbi:MAG: chorismate pyruvate-lyase family protein [Candidatus Sigynarchaeum springense]